MPQIGQIGLAGRVSTAHDAIEVTTTSEMISCVGYNSILVETNVSVAVKNWTIEVYGCLSESGTYTAVYDAATQMKYQTNASYLALFKGIPGYIKIKATEDEDGGKCTVRVQPINV